jgi:HK97 family phage major capsid protein
MENPTMNINVTQDLVDWLRENGHLTGHVNYEHAAYKTAELLISGELTPVKYKLLAGARPKFNTPKTEKAMRIADELPEEEETDMSVSAEKVFARGGHVRVKDPSEGYSTKRYTGRHVKTGEEVLNPFTGRATEYPSEQDHAKIGVFLKHLARKSGLFHAIAFPEHEKSLLDELANDPWAGMIGGEHRDNLTGVKALLDDATSGGTEITPLAFDDNLITFPLLTGELLPYVDLQPLDKGRRIMAGSLGNPTVSWGQGDDVAVDLFSTTSLVASLDSTVFGCAVAVEVGRDFLSDAGVNVGQALTANVGQRLQAELDKMIVLGNGTTQPEGITVATGLGSLSTDNGAAGPPTFADYGTAAFSIGKQYRVQAFRPRFISNDTTYVRSRNIKIDPTNPSVDQRPVLQPNTANQGFQDYFTVGWPHSIQNDLPNGTLVFGALSKYRLYRRLGMEVQWVQGGETLARKNLVLLVVRARYAGRVMDANAFAKWTDGQS